MLYYRNSDEIAHDVVITGPVRNPARTARSVVIEESYGVAAGVGG